MATELKPAWRAGCWLDRIVRRFNMSSDYKSTLTEGQEEILSGIPCVSQSAFAAMAMGQKQNETLGDENDLGYSLNMAYSHTSILHQQADYWKKRCKSAEDAHTSEIVRRAGYQDALAEIEAMAPKGSPIEVAAAKALGRPSSNHPSSAARRGGKDIE